MRLRDKLISFDTEAYRHKTNSGERQSLATFDFYDGASHYTGINKAAMYSMLNALSVKYGKIIIVAHNFSYDAQLSGLTKNLFVDNELCGLPLDKLIFSRPFFAQFSDDIRSIKLLDSFNYFNCSLATIAEAMGVKKTASTEYSLAPKEWNKYIRANYELVQNDTKILYDFMLRFIRQKSLEYGISIASVAFNTWHRHYYRHTIYKDKEINALALLSYRGGRCEAYRLNKEPVYLYDYDINSLYPYVMLHHRYSTALHRKYAALDINDIVDSEYNYLVNIDYELPSDCVRSPIVLRAKDGRLTQFLKYDNAWLTGREAIALKDAGANVVIHKALEFHAEDLFSRYVSTFYNLKKTALNDAERLIYKYMLNSLYGKFGQHKRQTEVININELPPQHRYVLEHTTKSHVSVDGIRYNIHNKYITISVDVEPKYNIVIASEITANARLVNYEIQKRLGFGHVYYTDTDSFFSDVKAPASLLGYEIGQLKIEHEGLCHVRGAKDYEFLDGLKKLKGIRHNATQLSDNEYIQQQFSSLLTRHRYNGVFVKSITKTVHRNANKLRYVRDSTGDQLGYPLSSG